MQYYSSDPDLDGSAPPRAPSPGGFPPPKAKKHEGVQNLRYGLRRALPPRAHGSAAGRDRRLTEAGGRPPSPVAPRRHRRQSARVARQNVEDVRGGIRHVTAPP